jgi:hypothetical protein
VKTSLPEPSRPGSNHAVTTATQEMALQAGDTSHRVYLNPRDGRDFLGIDEWNSAEAIQIWEGGWNEW